MHKTLTLTLLLTLPFAACSDASRATVVADGPTAPINDPDTRVIEPTGELPREFEPEPAGSTLPGNENETGNGNTGGQPGTGNPGSGGSTGGNGSNGEGPQNPGGNGSNQPGQGGGSQSGSPVPEPGTLLLFGNRHRRPGGRLPAPPPPSRLIVGCEPTQRPPSCRSPRQLPHRGPALTAMLPRRPTARHLSRRGTLGARCTIGSDGVMAEAEGSADDLLELRSRVPTSAAGKRLDDYLAGRFRYHSIARWRQEIAAGRVDLDGRRPAPESVVRAGATVLYRKLHREPPVDRDVRIVHSDSALLVVDKPAHLPIHGDGAFVRNTVVHVLRHELGFPEARIVHRLDRETSGLVAVARSTAARRELERQFAAGTVAKTYLAVVRGHVAEDFVCEAAIGHAAHSEIALRRSASTAARDAKPAATRFAVIERGPRNTLLRCEPATGRTHQLRVHLEHVGHPIVGDKLYGRPDTDYLEFVRRVKAGGDPRAASPGEPGRQLLHAAELALRHPDDGRPLQLEAPMPAEFREWLLATTDQERHD